VECLFACSLGDCLVAGLLQGCHTPLHGPLWMAVPDLFVHVAPLKGSKRSRGWGSCCDTLPGQRVPGRTPCLGRCSCKGSSEPGFPAPPGAPWYESLAAPWLLDAFVGLLMQVLVFVLWGWYSPRCRNARSRNGSRELLEASR